MQTVGPGAARMRRLGCRDIAAGVGVAVLLGAGCHGDGLGVPTFVEDASVPGVSIDGAMPFFDGGAVRDLVAASTDLATTLPGCRRALFTPATPSLTLPQPSYGQVLAADLDGDARLDLVVPLWGNGGVQLAWGGGDGTFTLPPS